MKISIHKFKKIEDAELELDPVNVLIGTNNSGKSSFIQGIQFAISSGQTLTLKKVNWRQGKKTLALDSSDYLYAPTRYIETLYNGAKLTGNRGSNPRKYIGFEFELDGNVSKVEVVKGKNGGLTTSIEGRVLGDQLSSISTPFCVYVPGIAGIPLEEKYEVPILLKKSATRGDSNNYLRNIILEISKDVAKWERFNESVNNIYGNTKVFVKFDGDTSEYIEVEVECIGYKLPLDSIGTGLLQAIQVFAYIEYFDPKLILLDEPDAHIHPTKQKLLALELFNRTCLNTELKIVFSTHSRYILEALEGKANVFHFQNGIVLPNIEEGKILLDIGAADADYLFSKRTLKYVIVTEDKVDNVNAKKDFINKFVKENGLSEDEFVLHSYEGCTRVDFARILKGFVAKQIPGIEIIVHYDRDQKLDTDQDIIRLKEKCNQNGLKCFVTAFSEIENYFCQPSHISEIYDTINLEKAQQIYNFKLSELEDETKRKIVNFILRDRPELGKNSNGDTDIAIVNKLRDRWYGDSYEKLTPGKELLGRIKDYIQNELGLDPNQILNASSGLECDMFKEIITEEEE